jgi:hypothetical protein
VTASDNVAAVRDFVDRAWNEGDESVFEEHLPQLDLLGLLNQLGALDRPGR